MHRGSKTCLVQFNKNKYSVMPQAVGRPVEVHAYADRITVRQDAVRRQLWIAQAFSTSPQAQNMATIPRALLDSLTEAACYQA